MAGYRSKRLREAEAALWEATDGREGRPLRPERGPRPVKAERVETDRVRRLRDRVEALREREGVTGDEEE